MHRWKLVLAMLLALLAGSVGTIAAQESTPVAGGSPFAALNATPLPLTVAEDGGVELPAELAAGRYEVTLDNPTDLIVDLIFVMAPSGAGTEELQATPVNEELGLPGWFYDAVLAGGVAADAQSSGSAVVELTQAGAWTVYVSAESVESGEPPAELLLPLTVSGEYDASANDDSGIPTVELVDYDFTISAGLQAGPQVWKVTNAGEHTHHLVLLKADASVTEGRIEQILQIEFGVPGDAATPEGAEPGAAADATTLEDVAYAQALSPGRSEFISVDLEEGFYVAICFIPDPETGQPHALMGMIEVFEVGGSGDTPGVATPAS
jgi:hypothetical protein